MEGQQTAILSKSVAEQVDVIVVGGGAAGFFAAITAAEAAPVARVLILERGREVLTKVRISGGGRCNVTHDCEDLRRLVERYPRGGKALLGMFSRFSPTHTVQWFQERGVSLKVEADGRMFPQSNRSETIVKCLFDAASHAGVEVRTNTMVTNLDKLNEGGFLVHLSDGSAIRSRLLLWAAGGCRPGRHLLAELGHQIVPPVPSLFSFDVKQEWPRTLAGVSVEKVSLALEDLSRADSGPLLFTHNGVSGPAVLRLSAWAARELHEKDYKFRILVDWTGGMSAPELENRINRMRRRSGSRSLASGGLLELPSRLWRALLAHAALDEQTQWARLGKNQEAALQKVILQCALTVDGKSTHKEEFVTAGGVDLSEMDMKRMASRVVPGLYVAGEALNIDGITGGFNFQAAWAGGKLAGEAMAADSLNPEHA